jgi:hypothetical protein
MTPQAREGGIPDAHAQSYATAHERRLKEVSYG